MKTSAISPVAVLYAKSLAFDVVALDRFSSLPSPIRSAFTSWVRSGFSMGEFQVIESAIQMFNYTDSEIEAGKIIELLRIHEIMKVLSGFSLSKLGDYVPESGNDDTEAEYLFSTTFTCLLAAIVNGQVDPILIAAETLAGRGLDSSGEWIGFKAAKSHDYFQNRK